jgi:hypothetical protein
MLLLPILPVIERLKALDIFVEVGGAAEYSVADERRQFVPAA